MGRSTSRSDAKSKAPALARRCEPSLAQLFSTPKLVPAKSSTSLAAFLEPKLRTPLRANYLGQQAQHRQVPAANMNTHQPVSSAIQGVEFGFLSTRDVRSLSVKRITNPTTFDSLLHPVSGGLHDAALGAFLDNA